MGQGRVVRRLRWRGV